jgi:hypothetical protein
MFVIHVHFLLNVLGHGSTAGVYLFNLLANFHFNRYVFSFTLHISWPESIHWQFFSIEVAASPRLLRRLNSCRSSYRGFIGGELAGLGMA